jgi:hypothetical protein
LLPWIISVPTSFDNKTETREFHDSKRNNAMTAFAQSLARDIRNAKKTGEEDRVLSQLSEAMGIENAHNGVNSDGGFIWQSQSGSKFNRRNQQIKANEFSIRDLFEHLVTHEDGSPVGRELLESFSPRKHGRNIAPLLEAGPIDHATFSNITGQIFFTSTLESFDQPELIGTTLTRNVPTDLQEEEKIPGISLPGDEAEAIGANQPYPEVGVSEEWVMTPEKVKRGYVLSLSKEAVFGDRTGLLLDRANKGAEMMGLNKEKRILDAVLGIDTLYRRNDGAAQATYGNTHTDGDFDNLETAALADWTDIEAALLLFDAITDPNTAEPIMIGSKQVVVPTALLFTAQRILGATETREVTNTNTTTLSPNPINATYTLLSNQYVADRTSSATQWFIGDFPRGFTYRENWPITTEEEREGGPRAFSHDTVARFKVSEKGAAAVEEARYGVRGN